MTKTTIRSPRLGDQFPTTRAVKSGNLIFLMGHVSVDDQSKEVVGKGDITTQTRRVFDRMKIALEDAGGKLEDLVHLVIYTTDRSQIPHVGQVRSEHFKGDWPTSSTVIVKALGNPECMIEIEGIAAVSPKEIIRSSRLGDSPPRSRAIKSDDFVFIMGCVSTDAQGKVVGKGDIKAQTRRVLDRIAIALEDSGATMEDLVQLTTFATDPSHLSTINEVKGEYFKADWPASATVILPALGNPDHLLEIEGIAAVSKAGATKKTIRIPRLGDLFPRARATQAGDLVFLMTHAPVDDQGQQVGAGDMYLQAKRCWEKVKITLEEVGATLEDLAQYTAYVTDASKLADFHRARAEFFKGDIPPGTVVEVEGLPRPEYLIEIKGIAAIS